MDLSTLNTSVKSSTGAVMYITHPTTGETLTEKDAKGNEEKMFLKVLGRDSYEFMQAAQESNKLIQEDDADELIATTVPFVVGGKVFIEGEWLEITKENTMEFLKKCRWMLPQIQDFAINLENFFPDASNN